MLIKNLSGYQGFKLAKYSAERKQKDAGRYNQPFKAVRAYLLSICIYIFRVQFFPLCISPLSQYYCAGCGVFYSGDGVQV